MTKAALISALAEELGIARSTARDLVEAVESITIRSIRSKGIAVIPGIARLVLAEVPARSEREQVNPRTGSLMKIPARPASRKVRVRVARSFRTRVGAQ